MVICDYFTKAIFAYDLSQFTGTAFLTRFREFLSTTGMVTRLLVVDNATIFSNLEVLTFLQTVGIKKIRGNANHSQSRGLVESSIRILQTLIRKLLAVSERYDYEHLLFFAPVLLNRAKNPITKISPYELLYSRDLSALGNLGTPITIPEYRLFSDQVKDDLAKLSQIVSDRISTVQQRISKEKEKYLSKVNSGRNAKPTLPQGTIVFVRNFSIPQNTERTR